MATLRVMVVDDQDVVRMGLKGFIGAEPRRAPQTLCRWAAAGLALAGPLIGIAGVIIGQAQTVGTVLMVASGVGIALVVRQELAVHDVAVAHFVWATGHIPREACRPAIQRTLLPEPGPRACRSAPVRGVFIELIEIAVKIESASRLSIVPGHSIPRQR